MKEIVNVSKNWGIGKDGDLLEYIPEDMKFFRETTKDAVVIMGSVTLDSFPNGAPLKNRVNIVLTDSEEKISAAAIEAAKKDQAEGLRTELIYVHSLEEAVALGKKYEEAGEEVFVIGGATIYRIMLPYCDECIVTINDSTREADTFFPNLEELGWKQIFTTDEKIYKNIKFYFTKWVK